MTPDESPIAADAAERNAPGRRAGSGRLATVRADFFLSPAERLTEQERALMTAMLHGLVGEVADELRAALPAGWAAANDDSNALLVEQLCAARLLDDPVLIALLLRRADEERIASGAKARSGRSDARVLQGLVSHEDGAVSAAAMALILARGRRRDRFGQSLLALDDLAPETAVRLVHTIAAALRHALGGGGERDAILTGVTSRLIGSLDERASVDALTGALVALLNDQGALNDELLLAAAHDGEIGFLALAVARRGGIPSESGIAELLSGDVRRIMALLRVAGLSRELSAGLLAGIGDLLGIADPGAAIGFFAGLTDEQLTAARAWLAAAPAYRAALGVLGEGHGQRSL